MYKALDGLWKVNLSYIKYDADIQRTYVIAYKKSRHRADCYGEDLAE